MEDYWAAHRKKVSLENQAQKLQEQVLTLWVTAMQDLLTFSGQHHGNNGTPAMSLAGITLRKFPGPKSPPGSMFVRCLPLPVPG